MVSVEEIKSAIFEREDEMNEILKGENIILRENLGAIKKFISKDTANIITGVRRCGKSVLAFQLGQTLNEKFGYVNFEDERLNIKADELNKVLEAIYSLKGDVELLIFDEIQNIGGWERFVTRILPSKKVIITGSNARLMSKEMATFLTGRHLNFVLYPFSFREFLEYKNIKYSKEDIYLTKNKAKLKDLLKEYISVGGFPSGIKTGRIFLSETYKDIVERDVIQRYKVKQSLNLKDLSKYLISNFASEISYNKLKDIVNVKSANTISNWVSYLENSYIVFKIERFSFKLKESIRAPKKIYSIDTGLCNAISFKFSENFGRLMENLVAVELCRRKSYYYPDWEIYYWKDYQQREVDFVIKEGLKVTELIQVTYASGKDEVPEREIKALIKASGELKCDNLTIITYDYEDEGIFDGKKIKFIPLWKWLLKI